MRKKIFAITLALASLGLMGSWSEAQASAVAKASTPQVRIRIGPQRRRYDDRYRDRYRDDRFRDNRFRERVVVQTRLVNSGWHTYRETYQIRYLPNGRTDTTVISRVRIN
jgi:hypothetical protein